MFLRIRKKYEKINFFASLESLKKGVGSGSVSQRYVSADPDPHQNVQCTDPEHCLCVLFLMLQEKARGVGGGEGIAGRFSSPDLQSQSRPTSTGSKEGATYTVPQVFFCTLYFVLCTVYFALCTLYSVLCTLYSVLCTLYFVLCTLYFVLAG
jgi:hypothetical protein